MVYSLDTSSNIKNYSKQYIKENVKDNILKRNFNQPGWVTDITYLIINGKRAYLSTILDLETRKVVSYHISKQNDNELVITTLLDAIKKKRSKWSHPPRIKGLNIFQLSIELSARPTVLRFQCPEKATRSITLQ